MNINELTAGTTLDFATEVADWPATDGWTLTYYLRGPSAIDLVSVAEGASYRITVSAATTTNWSIGTYAWEARVSKDGVVNKVASGSLTILKNIAAALTAPYDARTTAQQILDAVEALLTGFTDVEEYSIAGRSIKRMTRTELLQARQNLKAEVNNEAVAAALAAGLPNPRRLYIKTYRP